MNFQKSLLRACFISIVYCGSGTPLDSLQTGLKLFQGKSVEITLQQFQYGQVYNADVKISFFDTSTYLISSDEQDVMVTRNIIKTWNKKTKQLIIDLHIPEDKDIFSFMRGDITGIELYNRRSQQDYLSFDYTMADLGYNGELTVEKNNWRLQLLKIEYDQENWVLIQLKNWEWLTSRSDIEQFGKNAREIIDLRE